MLFLFHEEILVDVIVVVYPCLLYNVFHFGIYVLMLLDEIYEVSIVACTCTFLKLRDERVV